ncbi:hypothetical protein TNCV_424891 [Trichonephila clavipes]|nr:hypothetical protein TNCV_424891 [Trichonephila clavipes]
MFQPLKLGTTTTKIIGRKEEAVEFHQEKEGRVDTKEGGQAQNRKKGLSNEANTIAGIHVSNLPHLVNGRNLTFDRFNVDSVNGYLLTLGSNLQPSNHYSWTTITNYRWS